MARTRKAPALALILALAGFTAVQAGTEGKLSGVVEDSKGKPLEGVLVTVTAQEGDYTRQATSDRKGRFNLIVMDATKTYDIRLEKEGYLPAGHPLKLEIGGTSKLKWTLVEESVAAQSEEMAAAVGRSRAAKLYNDGVKDYNDGDPESALTKFEAAVAEDETLFEAYAGMAQIYLEREDWAKGEQAATKVVELAPDEARGHRFLHDALLAQENEAGAESALDRLIEIDPGPGTAVRVFNSGVRAAKAQELELAIKRFEQAVELAPSLKEAHLNLAFIQLAKEDFESALLHADAYLAEDPEGARALSAKYQAHRALGDVDAAEAAFVRLKDSHPEFVTQTFFEEGSTQFNAGNAVQAIAAFQRVLAAEPNHPRAHYMLGLCHASAGQVEMARQFLTRFIELAPDDPEASIAREMLAGL